MRLIDADALLKGKDDHQIISTHLIWNAPTVDAVQVVRCGECKHRPTKPDDYDPITTDGFALEFPDEKCPCQCEDGWYSKYPDDNWYCADGERREE